MLVAYCYSAITIGSGDDHLHWFWTCDSHVEAGSHGSTKQDVINATEHTEPGTVADSFCTLVFNVSFISLLFSKRNGMLPVVSRLVVARGFDMSSSVVIDWMHVVRGSRSAR